MNQLLEKGTFTLSIDTELAWGSVHNNSFGSRRSHYQQTRQAVNQLLALQTRYEIQATWAVVGHLFLSGCSVEGGVKHPEITRPAYRWFLSDWFDADPCGSAETDPCWYGPDIVDQIRNCNVSQEIGCHSFSHMIVGDPGCSRECFDSEIRACVDQARKWDIELRSFVFPRNSLGHLDVLAEHGFTCFRGKAPDWYASLPGPGRRLGRALDELLPVAPPVTTPKGEGILWNIPASYFYPHRDGWGRAIPLSWSVNKVKLGLEKAIGQRSLFHLWFHPFNLASDLSGLLKGLEIIFEQVYKLREAGGLDNLTMGDLAESLQQVGQEVAPL